MSKLEGMWRECASCGEDVHVRSKACKCGAASPWKLADVPLDSAAVEHPPAAPADTVYMVSKGFTLSSPVTQVFPQGKIITDKFTIRRLLDGNAPIVPVEDVTKLATCPECKHVFLKV